MPKAIWNDVVIAESDATVVVDGNHYFPPDSLRMELLQPNAATTVCGWKGTASYYDVVVDGQVNEQAAWVYREPKPEAESIKGRVAFWKGVAIEDPSTGASDGPAGQCEI